MKMHNKLHVLGMLLILMVPILLMVAVANAQPANDAYANATGISNLPFTDITINTSAATVSPSDDPSNCYDPFNTVWYKGTPNANLEIEANTFGSGYNTTLTVVTGSPGSFTLIACNDDSGISGSEVQSQVTFNATAGVTYYFMVGSKATGGGNLVFNAISTSLGEVILVPTANAALQGVVLFKAKASDFSSIYPVSGMSFNVREPGGDYGTPIGGVIMKI